jgi:hypothetical protein
MPFLRRKAPGAFRAIARRRAAVLIGIVAVVAVLVIAMGIGGFAVLARPASPAPSVSRGAARMVTSSTPTPGPRPGSSPTAHPQPTATPVGTTALLTCTEIGSQTGRFSFSGVVTGALAFTSFQACYSATPLCFSACSPTGTSVGHTFYGKGQGKINGISCEFEFLITPYGGPGTYSARSSINVVLMQNNHEWQSYGAPGNRASIVVNSGGKTGSLRATISMIAPNFDPTSIVTVTGTWSA